MVCFPRRWGRGLLHAEALTSDFACSSVAASSPAIWPPLPGPQALLSSNWWRQPGVGRRLLVMSLLMGGWQSPLVSQRALTPRWASGGLGQWLLGPLPPASWEALSVCGEDGRHPRLLLQRERSSLGDCNFPWSVPGALLPAV